MKQRIFITIIILIASAHSAFAFWGSDSRDKNSGLDLAGGYDTNTVTRITGKIVAPPARHEGGEHTEMSLVTGQGSLTVILGPWSYWERQDFSLSKGQEISITGSRAIGKDGNAYLFAQKLEIFGDANRSISLRSESGTPAWSRSGSGAGMGSGAGTGTGRNGGGGYRGGSMRGGGRR